jgi:hypothetical protein
LCPVSRAFLGYCNDVMCRCTQFIQNTFDLWTSRGVFSHISHFLFQSGARTYHESLKHPLPECIFVRFNENTCWYLQC